MAYVGNQAQTAFTSFDKQTITGDGTAVYTLSHSVANDQEVEVFVNNVRQEGGSGKAYTVSGNQITFSENIASTDDCYVVFQGKAVQTVVPPAGSVTDSMITDMSSSKLTGALPALDGSALTGVSAGKVLKVVTTNKTDTFSTTSTSFVDVTGLSVQITPSSASSKILVTGALVGSTDSTFFFVRLMRDSTQVLIPDSTGNRTTANFGFATHNPSTYIMQTVPIHALDSPSSTSALTYKIQIECYSGTSYVNRTSRDSDNVAGYDPRGVSTITVAEIEG